MGVVARAVEVLVVMMAVLILVLMRFGVQPLSHAVALAGGVERA